MISVTVSFYENYSYQLTSYVFRFSLKFDIKQNKLVWYPTQKKKIQNVKMSKLGVACADIGFADIDNL